MANHYGFEGRVALVTGGASGIGAATLERLRASGAEVHVFDLANGDDVRDSAQLNAAVERLPRLDVLVCCAGVGGDSLHTEDVSDEEWERVHAINLNGVFYANRAAIPKMKAGGYGRRSEEHTSELQSQSNLVCRLLLEKKKKLMNTVTRTIHN